jgi:hypothetical protein
MGHRQIRATCLILTLVTRQSRKSPCFSNGDIRLKFFLLLYRKLLYFVLAEGHSVSACGVETLVATGKQELQTRKPLGV